MQTSDILEFLNEDEAKRLFKDICAAGVPDATVTSSLSSKAMGTSKWVRNDMQASSTFKTNDLRIEEVVNGATMAVQTTRVDHAGVIQAMSALKDAIPYTHRPLEYFGEDVDKSPVLHPKIWSDSTHQLDSARRTAAARQMMVHAENRGMFVAGDLKVGAESRFRMDTVGNLRYYQSTVAECSMTARDPKRSASGWAGVNDFDIGNIDLDAIAQKAIDKCERSANPVAVEPGRYTAILEPQAVADLFSPLILSQMSRTKAEDDMGPFAAGKQQSKIGQKVVDERLMVVADPLYPGAGFIPFEVFSGAPYRPVNWIENGVLKELEYDKRYALASLHQEHALPNSGSYVLKRASGVPAVSIDEMIANTERGLLVTRFSDIRILDSKSMLSAGYTRDGVWLIEKGKVTQPVRNFRFTESPLFALNSLQDVGEEMRVFAPGYSIMAPPVRVRDFNFSSLADAV